MVFLPNSLVGELALGEAIDAVVEQDDLQADVLADRVDEMVAADAETVAVAGHDPDVEVGIGQLDAGGDGRGAAVDAVETVGVHVVGKSAGAADAGDEDGVFLFGTDLGHHLLHLVEDGVVATTGAPAHLLAAFEILCC